MVGAGLLPPSVVRASPARSAGSAPGRRLDFDALQEPLDEQGAQVLRDPRGRRGRYRGGVDHEFGPTRTERNDDFDELVERAIAGLPAPFLERLDSVAIVVEDEPSSAQLRSVGARGLYGLYQGVPRTAWGASGAALPSKISIFRGPLERSHRDPASLAAAVEEVVRHEVAHHLGIDDARLAQLSRERRARASPRPGS